MMGYDFLGGDDIEDLSKWGNGNEDDFVEDLSGWGEMIPEKNKMEIAKDIMSVLEGDDEVMGNFNFLLRQKKLRQLKENK